MNESVTALETRLDTVEKIAANALKLAEKLQDQLEKEKQETAKLQMQV